jgi:hypothetical protein
LFHFHERVGGWRQSNICLALSSYDCGGGEHGLCDSVAFDTALADLVGQTPLRCTQWTEDASIQDSVFGSYYRLEDKQLPIVSKPFELGPAAPLFRRNMRTLYAPALSDVRVSLRNVTVGELGSPFQVPLLIQVMKASRDSIGVSGPDGPVVIEREKIAPFQSLSLGPFFSDFGCPSTTRVRVTGLLARERVSGIIDFDYDPPSVVRLKMAGSDTLSLDGDQSQTKIRDLRPGLLPIADGVYVPGLPIYGTGKFRIKAKWHTDFWAFARPQILRVSLLRPDGTVAAEESGFSRHISDDDINNYPAYDDPSELDGLRQRINFGYTVRPEDIQNIDQSSSFWKVKVGYEPTFPPGYSGPKPRIVDFDIDSGKDSTFSGKEFFSTFQAGCF